MWKSPDVRDGIEPQETETLRPEHRKIRLALGEEGAMCRIPDFILRVMENHRRTFKQGRETKNLRIVAGLQMV